MVYVAPISKACHRLGSKIAALYAWPTSTSSLERGETRSCDEQRFLEQNFFGTRLAYIAPIETKHSREYQVCTWIAPAAKLRVQPCLVKSVAVRPALFVCRPKTPESESQNASNRVVLK